MNSIKSIGMIAAACAVILTSPLHAQSTTAAAESEQLRKLDIMLMVSSLRCRTTVHDFRGDYANFTKRHLTTLNAASRSMQSGMTARYGQKGAKRRLDRISVGMANRYGQGHPWLSCQQLKQHANSLANMQHRDELLTAATHLLRDMPSGGTVLAARK